MYEQPRTGRTDVGGDKAMGSTTQTATQTEVADLMQEAKQTVSEAVGNINVKPMVTHQLDNGVHKAGERLGAAMANLNEVADELEQRGNSGTSKLLRSAAEPADRITKYLENTGSEQMIADANRYAKEHMWTVIAAGALLGIVASRFIKAAVGGSPQQPQQMSMRPTPQGQGRQMRGTYQGAV